MGKYTDQYIKAAGHKDSKTSQYIQGIAQKEREKEL